MVVFQSLAAIALQGIPETVHAQQRALSFMQYRPQPCSGRCCKFCAPHPHPCDSCKHPSVQRPGQPCIAEPLGRVCANPVGELSMLSALQGRNKLAESHSVAEGNAETHISMPLQATLCIERALHVLLPPSDTTSASAASVTAQSTEGHHGLLSVAFEWGGVPHTTPAVALSHAASANWQYQAALPVSEAGPGSGGELQPAVLHLQVGRTQTKHTENRKEGKYDGVYRRRHIGWNFK